jgi:hypothetical protein
MQFCPGFVYCAITTEINPVGNTYLFEAAQDTDPQMQRACGAAPERISVLDHRYNQSPWLHYLSTD